MSINIGEKFVSFNRSMKKKTKMVHELSEMDIMQTEIATYKSSLLFDTSDQFLFILILQYKMQFIFQSKTIYNQHLRMSKYQSLLP